MVALPQILEFFPVDRLSLLCFVSFAFDFELQNLVLSERLQSLLVAEGGLELIQQVGCLV